jgi:hypothetical protein
MAEIFTTHGGQPVAVSSKGHTMLKPITRDSSPRTPPPAKAGDLRRAAKTRRRNALAEKAREGTARARTYATGRTKR